MTTRAVIDASVAVKWLLRESPREQDTLAAMQLLEGVTDGSIEPIQPPHWLAEVAAVVARVAPELATDGVQFLHALQLSTSDAAEVYVEACRLATELDHHLFDTLYHAVARCEPGATCITADEAYYRKAHAVGSLTLLRDFRPH